MKSWIEYFQKHKTSIETWIEQFTPWLVDEYKKTNLDEEALKHFLNKAWWEAPDDYRIRTNGFFHLTDLLDESWRDAK